MRYLSNVATLQFFADKCTGCGQCIEVCPHGVFAMNGRKAYVTEQDLCMECGACERNCAFGAIQVKAGVGCTAAIINGLLRGGEPTCDCSSSAGACCG